MVEAEEHPQLCVTLADTVPSLPVRPSIIKQFAQNWPKANFDDTTLERIAGPLSLAKPGEIMQQLEPYGGLQFLLSQEMRKLISAYAAEHQVEEILVQLAKAAAAALQAHRRGGLVVSLAVVARALAAISISSSVPAGDGLRRDLATILAADSDDTAGLMGRYRMAVSSGNIGTVEAVDKRITCDAIWGSWAEVFLKEGNQVAQPRKPITYWELASSPMPKDSANDIRDWLFRRRL